MTNPPEVPTATDRDGPCRCVTFRAAVSPTHPGHCCFLPATQTCHAAEITAWAKRRKCVGGHR